MLPSVKKDVEYGSYLEALRRADNLDTMSYKSNPRSTAETRRRIDAQRRL